jgi:hypothetical protein
MQNTYRNLFPTGNNTNSSSTTMPSISLQGGNIAPIFSNRSTGTTGSSLWGHILGTSGKKDGSGIVRDVQNALRRANLSEREYFVLITLWKSLPLRGANEIDQVNQNNQAERNRRFKPEQGWNFSQSVPQKKLDANIDLFKSTVAKIRAGMENPELLGWGSLAQTEEFMEIAQILTEDGRLAIPKSRQMVMKKFTYNVVSFDAAYTMATQRIIAGITGLTSYAKYGKKVNAGALINGKKQTSDSYDFEVIPDNARPQFKLETDERVSLDAIVQGGKASELIQVANFVNVHLLLQSPQMRQRKGELVAYQEMGGRVAAVMAMVIAAAGGKTFTTATLDPKGDFCQEYFRCNGIMKATLRNLNYRLFGQTGGANTRVSFSGSVNVEVAKVKPIF